MKFSALTLSLFAAPASAATIGSYESVNDVSAMISMGPDLDAIGDALGDADLATAKTIYENGGDSSISFQSLSMDGKPLQNFVDYYGSNTYGDEYIQAVFAGATFAGQDFSGMGADGQEQIIKKGAAYMNAYMSAIEKAQAAVSACNDDDKDGAVLAWDMAAALFYGSDGEIVYAMGEKRCGNFGTCVNGESAVNRAIFESLNEGQASLQDSKCKTAGAAAQEIVSLMQVPLVQGVLRAAYKLDMEGGGEKELGYGTVFASAVLPFVETCNSKDAATIASNMAPDATSTDFSAVKAAFENNYECLGFTCADINGLVDDNGEYLKGATACGVDVAPAKSAPTNESEPAAEKSASADEEMTEDDSSASMVGVVGSAVIATSAFAMLL